MEKKITRKDMFTAVSDFLVQNNATDEMIDFINHQIELVSRKPKAEDGKPTKAQIENADLAEALYAEMIPETAYYGEDILNTFAFTTQYNETHEKELSNSKLTNIMKPLVESGRVKKETVKRKTVYTRRGA